MFTATRARLVGAAVLTLFAVTACDPGMSTSMPAPSSSSMAEMPMSDGLADQSSGYRFVPAGTSLTSSTFRFQIVGADGKPVTSFDPEQTKLLHFYLVRSDLSGFQHLHPTMAADGTWTVSLAAVQPGTYRAYTQFVTKGTSLVLSQQLTVAGAATVTPLPAASTVAEADGYTLTLGGDSPMAGMSHNLTVTVSEDGKPVTDLQPYLDTYAHLTAFHEGDMAFAHLHPQGAVNGDHGGPELTFEAMFAKSGNWRLYVQFQTAGVLHTAAVTVSAR